jgi:hypothetical protein
MGSLYGSRMSLYIFKMSFRGSRGSLHRSIVNLHRFRVKLQTPE